MAGLIDTEAEVKRLQKELEKLDNEQSRIRAKLENEAFVSKAPEQVVNTEKQKLEEAESAAKRLQHQLAEIQSL